ncbi:D-glycero-alpha-D-manno-heptose-1,7-bisphosphate 7-phosphatase [Nocardia caishijiensis]|uniref:D,D-heptose 1,7-bisphosphate phosphatase n=1 Tax=Nocardia caishijiensis TaxID=184756 RepID=A0ABQ6YM46_9NOCA|nr:HAD family hydrolase [Nocardia caishijiensis]KAF0846864.1 HAD superfamily hydrolase (TIGR01509 family) [Nocardia caishijiensis]
MNTWSLTRTNGSARNGRSRSSPPAAVLFDRDATLIDDVPYLGDPTLVRPVPGAVDALTRLRAENIPLGVVSNQSGIARGLITYNQVRAVNTAVEQLLGSFDTWQICPHGPDDSCACRKPAPGMILRATAELGVAAADCVLIGDIGADIAAAQAAGCAAILVPTPVTRRAEIDHAHATALVAPDLPTAVALAMAGATRKELAP